MPHYTYIAIDARGVRVSGEMEASDPDTVVSCLSADGARIESVQMTVTAPSLSIDDDRAQGIAPGDAREISGHIAEIVSAGLPLETGLAAMAEEFPRGRLQRTLQGIVRDLQTGADLEAILARRSAPGYLAAMMRAGKRTGRTVEILENFIGCARVASELRQTMWMALAYPLVLLLLLVPLGLFLIRWIVPSFEAVLQGFEIKLPLLTEMLLTVSRFVAEDGSKALGGLFTAIAVLCVVMRLAFGAAGTRWLLGFVPVIGPLLRWQAMARFAPLLSLMIESRVPLSDALVLAGDAAGDPEIRADCRKLSASLCTGLSLEAAAGDLGRFPASFVRALSWKGHRDGLPEILQAMADMYAERARAIAALLLAIVPPLVILLVGLVTGFTVIALFMPLIELLNKLS